MKRLPSPPNVRPTLLMLALLAAYGTAAGQGNEADKYALVEGSASVGLGLISGDSAERAQFGQYNGLRNAPTGVGLLDFDYLRRDARAGTAINFSGTNLGLQTRELRLGWNRQGDWKVFADYNEQLHYDPYSVNSGSSGLGTTNPQVAVLPGGAGTGDTFELKIKRTAFGLGLWKAITPAINFEAKFNTEDRNGARAFGSGFTCPSATAPGCPAGAGNRTGSAILFLPEPIDSNTTLVDVRVSYAHAKLNLSAGYYGSFYKNSNSALQPSVPGSLNNALGTLLPLSPGLQPILNMPLALPPDNQAQFIDVTGNYLLAPTTNLKFKLGYSWLTQDQNFASSGLSDAPPGAPDLGGSVNTGLALVGLTSRPTPQLTLNADASYRSRNDSTPIALYNVEGINTYTNRSYPLQTIRARLGAGYQFNTDYRGTIDVGYESLDRGTFTPTSAVAGVSALRQTTDETGVRLEVRRRMVEDFSGAITLSSAWRNGSDWLKPNSGTGVAEVTDPDTAFTPTAIFPSSLANRRRDKLKLTVNWQASEALALQFLAEGGQDEFSSPTNFQEGLEKTRLNLFGIDADYVLSEDWRLTGFVSTGVQQLHQTRPAGYILSYEDTTTTLGIGFSGKPMQTLQVGGNLGYIISRSAYAQALQPTTSPANATLLAVAGGLPDVIFRQTSLNLFGTYDIDKRSAVRVNLVYQYNEVRDWAWSYGSTPYAYSDATTLYQQPTQSVGMLGVAYIYRF
jgi:MtrB/PioB family decaheme-associated outer membrane protein